MAAAPSPLAPPRGNPRFPLLDALRAIAALSIVLTHTAAVTNFNSNNPLGAYTARLNFGVALFFVLSGFLLYRPFVAARLQGAPPIGIREFTRRRLLRIVPAYWVALVTMAVVLGIPAFWEGTWWRSFAFTQIYWRDSIVQGIGPAWTLCIEMSFYLALPFLAAGLGRLAGRRWGVELVALGAIAAASLALRTVLQGAGGSYVMQSTLPAFMDWFCVGMAMAVVSVAYWGREEEARPLAVIVRRPWVPWLLAAVAFWAVSTQLGLSRDFAGAYTDVNYFGEHVLFVVCAALLMLPAVFGHEAGGWLRSALAWRPLAWLGLVSYGIFLYHGPIFTEMKIRNAESWLPVGGLLSLTIPTLALSIACAAASYYLIERPALSLRRRPGRARPPARRQASAPAR